MTIKHLILPGGGPIGLYVYGALKRLNELKYWNIKDLKSIYCTSIGSFIGIITILDLNWEWIDDFLIKRPWNKILDLNNVNYLNVIFEKGLLDNNISKNMIEPLLKAKGLSNEITLKEFFEFSNINIYFYSTNLNSISLDCLEINHNTYPDMKLYDALYSSMNIPFIFKPNFFKDKCLIDGGLVNNNPIKSCLDNEKCNIENILFFTNSTKNEITIIEKDIDIFKLLLLILSKLALTIMLNNYKYEKCIDIKNIIYCDINNGSLNINYWIKVLNNLDERKNIIQKGIDKANEFYSNIINSTLDNIVVNDLSNISIDLSNNTLYKLQ